MSTLRAFVDRFEDRMAVILVGDDEYRVVLPRDMLPTDAVEGSVLDISIDVNSSETDETKRRIKDILDELSGEDA